MEATIGGYSLATPGAISVTTFGAVARLPSYGERRTQRCVHNIGIRRHTLESLLIRESGPAKPNARAAIYLLGLYRMSSAAPRLVEEITCFPLGEVVRPLPLVYLGRPFPAVNALISIGMPSVRAIIKILPQEANPLRRKLMVRVLIGVEGNAVTRFRLERAIAKAPNAIVKANLAAALDDVPASSH